jgi:hypothetical protein
MRPMVLWRWRCEWSEALTKTFMLAMLLFTVLSACLRRFQRCNRHSLQRINGRSSHRHRRPLEGQGDGSCLPSTEGHFPLSFSAGAQGCFEHGLLQAVGIRHSLFGFRYWERQTICTSILDKLSDSIKLCPRQAVSNLRRARAGDGAGRRPVGERDRCDAER